MGSNRRLAALDHLRGLVVALVVLHHAVLPYCTFSVIDRRHYLLSTAPVVDPRRWAGFDVLATLNDAFFMPLMFLLSGLFVWQGLRRHSTGAYLRGRVLRLALSFAAAVLTVVPLAYYPSWLQAGGAPGFPRYWATMVTAGPWPSGPPWFIAVLLVFDTATALLFAAMHRAGRAPSLHATTPARAFALLLPCLLLAYLPFLALFGPSFWLSLGPLAIQASRTGLYAASFAAGVAFGAAVPDAQAATVRAGLARRWPAWAMLAALSALVLIGTLAARRHGALPGWTGLAAYAAAFTLFCAAACFAATSACLCFAAHPNPALGSLAACRYGIYLLHYPVVTWIQFGLLHAPMGPIGKAATTFVAALALSWILAALARRTPRIPSLG